MATIQRPVKTYGTRSYVAEVAAAPGNEDPILASEVDGDLDTIFAAWNGGADSVNIKAGAVTYAKLAPDAQLWQDTGTTLTPGANYTSRPVTIPGDASFASVVLGSATLKGRLQTSYTGTTGLVSGLFTNRNWANSNAQDDATKPSWAMQLSANDSLLIQRSPAGSTTQTNLLTLDSAGNLTTIGPTTSFGVAGVDGFIRLIPRMYLKCGNNPGFLDIAVNSDASVPSFTQGFPGWLLRLDYQSTGTVNLMHRTAGVAGIDNQNSCIWYANGDMQISGANATKASGTTWINPSDRRLKDSIEDYATGLAAILQLQPRTFVYNGKGGSLAGMRGYGFIADEMASVMPETIGVRASKLDPDDEDETDIQTLDQSNLILALVNAVKELAARVATLEGAAV